MYYPSCHQISAIHYKNFCTCTCIIILLCTVCYWRSLLDLAMHHTTVQAFSFVSCCRSTWMHMEDQLWMSGSRRYGNTTWKLPGKTHNAIKYALFAYERGLLVCLGGGGRRGRGWGWGREEYRLADNSLVSIKFGKMALHWYWQSLNLAIWMLTAIGAHGLS